MTNHALIVGYSDYIHYVPVPGVKSTAASMKEIFAHRCEGAERAMFDNIKEPLIDVDAGTVQQEFHALCQNVAPGDRVVLVLIGHGAFWGDTTPELQLATHLADPDMQIEAHWLNVNSLVNRLDAKASIDRLVLIDCCGAGALRHNNSNLAHTLDGTDDSARFLQTIRSNETREALAGRHGRVAHIVTSAIDQSAWIGIPLADRADQRYSSLIKRAARRSEFLRQAEEPGALLSPTFYCQAVAICHYISSNAWELSNDDDLTDDQKKLVRKIKHIMSPDEINGAFWANEATEAAAYLLDVLGVPQTPSYVGPRDGGSHIALSAVSGKSRKDRLIDLRERVKNSKYVSDAIKGAANQSVKLLIDTRPRDMLPRMKNLESELRKITQGHEHLITEALLNYKFTTEIYANIEEVRKDVTEKNREKIDKKQEEIDELKNKLTALTKEKGGIDKSLKRSVGEGKIKNVVIFVLAVAFFISLLFHI